MNSDIQNWCRVGYFIDAKDNTNEWCVAEVKEINKLNVHIILDGWGPRWETAVQLKSSKLAPFRKMSKGYTGPKAKSYRNFEFNLEILRKMQEKVQFLSENSLLCEDAFETTQFYRGKLFAYVDNILTQKPLFENIVPIIEFCLDVLKLIAIWLKSAIDLFPFYYSSLVHSESYLTENSVALACCWYELLDLLKKIFGLDSRTADFFNVVDSCPENFNPSVNAHYKPKTAFYFVNFFQRESGLDSVIKIIRNEDEKSRVPFGFLNQLCVYDVVDYFDSSFSIAFYKLYNESILKRIEMVTETELKDLKYEEVILLINKMKKSKSPDQGFIYELLKLNFFLKMLKSVYLEKRIKALTEISNMIETLELRLSNFDQFRIKTHQDILKNWLVNEKILSLVLTDRPHVELIKRSGVILKFFAKQNLLDNAHLDQLWNSILFKHESYVRATYETIVDLSSVLKESQNDYLFNEFLKVSIENYDESFLCLLKDFTVKAITTAKLNANFSSNQKIYGIKIFQELMLDKSPYQFRFVAIKYLVYIINENYYFTQRLECYKIIKKLIKENNSVVQALKLFLSLNKHMLKIKIDTNESNLIEKVYDLKDSIIDNFTHHLKYYPDNPAEIPLQEQEIHYKYIRIILQFLGNLSHNSESGLSIDDIDKLWQAFTAKNNKECELFFSWLNYGQKSKPPISTENIPSIFLDYFLRDDRFFNTCWSIYLFNCFQYFFCEYNSMQNAIDLTDLKQIKYRKKPSVKGLKKLLSIQLYSQNEMVSERAARLIFAMNSRFEPDLLPDAEEIVDKVLYGLLKIIQTHKSNDYLVMRALLLIRTLMDKFDDENDYNSYVHIRKPHTKEFAMIKINQNKTLRHLRKEAARYCDRPIENTQLNISERRFGVSDDDLDILSLRYTYFEVESVDDDPIEYNPYNSIKKNQEVMKTLLELLSNNNKIYTDLAWKLLLALPTCKSSKKALKNLKQPIKELIDLSSTHKLLYTLKILLKQSNDPNWVEKFKMLGGTQFLMDIFTDHHVEPSLVKLVALKEEIILPVLSNILQNIEDDPKIIQSFFQSYSNVAKAAACGEKIEEEKKYFTSLKKILNIIQKHSLQSLVSYLQNTSIQSLLQYIFIDCSNAQFVESSLGIFKKLEKIPNCFDCIHNQFFVLLESAVTQANKTSGFWDIFSKQVKVAENNERLSNLAEYLLEQLKNYPSEINSVSKDEILCGILKVLKSAWGKSKIELSDFHLKLILQESLCEIPESKHDNFSPPKCKHFETRSSGFELLLELCRANTKFLAKTTSVLDTFHSDPSWRTSRKADWNNSPMSKEKSQTGYVGLKNLGCTCYMNSILQQLFMIPSFRNSILQCSSVQSDDNLLYQLQYIFSGLRSSDKQYINPKNFARAFKDSEGNSINIVEQMDVDEFFGSFMDKLENLLKNTQFQDLIKFHFGGLQATEIIGKECPHRRVRYEPFLSIPVEVKNKKSLLEGLESYVSEELLEGENSYQCDDCEAKVKAIRRVCVKHLPNYLIISLRRFEFDFDTMSREKLNDYFEFPFELNMEPYTQEGLDNEKEKECKDYYFYKLRGIVIHSGTAENGHYFSYISENNTWVDFNDIWVNLINPENIPNDCFGGEEKFQYNAYSKITMREKFGNAYMLIYERNLNFKPRNADDEPLESIDLNVNNVDKIEESLEIKKQNQKYWRSKIIFGPEYFTFVSGISKIEEIDLKYLIRFYVTVMIRSKEKKNELFEIYERIESELEKNSKGIADWFLDMVCVEEVNKELLIFNPMYLMRRLLVSLTKSALKNAGEQMKIVFYRNVIQNLKLAKKKISKHFAQFLEILKISVFSCANYLNMHEVTSTIINYLISRSFEIPEPAPHMHSDIYLGYQNYYNEDSFKDDGFHIEYKGTSQSHNYCLLFNFRKFIPDTLKEIIKLSPITLQFINDCDNKLSCQSIGKLYAFLFCNDISASLEFQNKLFELMKSPEMMYKKKIVQILIPFLAADYGFNAEKINHFIEHCWTSFKSYKALQENEYIINFLYKVCSKIPAILETLSAKPEVLSYIEKWIRSNMIIVMPNRNSECAPEEHTRNTYKILLNKCERMKNKDLLVIWDSDEEISENLLEPGKYVDLQDSSANSWQKAKIEQKAGDIALLSYMYQREEVHLLKDLQSDDIAPPDTKSKGF